ncbi:hypothetical protein CXG81DRAFT_16153 [Caulochytrium protostelioides]|uniref:Tctex1 domain-containing protein 2 n=1 Tax=Caulochytrium protostelioides TaxID=1555241 RepID=A0A4P9WXR2_9FUNG|nr:Tctex1 domain-containing protein 2 [Caulochytrium protostelioides]RKO98269.1 hypothetical protein CXG81DRAFT_16153 [Caulochytrium protostelioides]|eukprot:RKO98269.1 hypothetical protein CXG81DRAFT_16153 [Caulochytrium protostelioides]
MQRVLATASDPAGIGENNYRIRPESKQKFRAVAIQHQLRQILQTTFAGQAYSPETASQQGRDLAERVKEELKRLDLPRYKFVVHVHIGERGGQGMLVNAKCLWDADTDATAHETYMNDTMFCSVSTFAVYVY